MSQNVKAPVLSSPEAVSEAAVSEAQTYLAKQAEEIAALKAQIAALKAGKAPGKITVKLSEKGCVAVYGLGRFPVSLYRGQMERLIAPETVEAIRKFIDANKAALDMVEARHAEAKAAAALNPAPAK